MPPGSLPLLTTELMTGQSPKNEIATLSMLAFAMTFVVLSYGAGSEVGIIALALQAGLLLRVNYVHRTAVRESRDTAHS